VGEDEEEEGDEDLDDVSEIGLPRHFCKKMFFLDLFRKGGQILKIKRKSKNTMILYQI